MSQAVKSLFTSLLDTSREPGSSAGYSFDVSQKLFDIDGCIPKSALEGITIHLVVKREHNAATIDVLHFHMAPLAVNLHEAHSLQGSQNLSACKKR